ERGAYGGPAARRVAQQVGAVGELVDRSQRRQVAQPRIGDRGGECAGEPAGVDDLEGAFEVRPDLRRQRVGQGQPVVQGGDAFISQAQLLFASSPAGARDRAGQRVTQVGGSGQAGEGGAQPFAVRGV